MTQLTSVFISEVVTYRILRAKQGTNLQRSIFLREKWHLRIGDYRERTKQLPVNICPGKQEKYSVVTVHLIYR